MSETPETDAPATPKGDLGEQTAAPTELGEGTDVTADPADTTRDADAPSTATSDATAFSEQGETQGGTGGLDSGGAG